MESRVFKVNPNGAKEFPYFARDTGGSNYVWFIKGKSTRRGYLKAALVGEHDGYAPFEYEGEIRASSIVKITRARLTLLIGSNIG